MLERAGGLQLKRTTEPKRLTLNAKSERQPVKSDGNLHRNLCEMTHDRNLFFFFFLRFIPHLQLAGRDKTFLFPGGGSNLVHSETGGWQTDVCSPQLRFCLSGWIKSSTRDIMSQTSVQGSRTGPQTGRPYCKTSDRDRNTEARLITGPEPGINPPITAGCNVYM